MQIYTVSSKKLWDNGKVLKSRYQPVHRVRLLRQERERLKRLVERHRRKIK